MLLDMEIWRQVRKYVDTPVSWAVVGFAIGIAFGVTSISVWLLAIGLGFFLLYLRLQGPAKKETEGRLFSSAPIFMVAWILGFVVHGIAGIGF